MFKVLIVDDEVYIREGLKVLIQWNKLGFEVCGQAENGEHAFKMLIELKPDVIITDIKMPLMNGLELIKKVNGDLKLNVKFIVLSGYNEFDYAKTAMKYNVKNYILKPIEEEELEIIAKELYNELYEERNNNEANLRGINAVSDISLKTLIKSTADKESVDNVKKFLNVGDTGYFRYLMIHVEKSDNLENEQTEETEKDNSYIINCLVEILGEEYKLNLLVDDYSYGNTVNYGIIVTENLLINYKNDISYFVELIYTQLTIKVNKKIYIYVGKVVNELFFLRKSYDSAIFTHSIRFYKNNFKVIYYDDIKDLRFCSKFNEIFDFDDLVEAIENKNNAGIVDIIDNAFDEANSNLIDLKLLYININFLVYQIVKIVSKMNGETTDILKYGSNFDFDDFMTLSEIKDSIKTFSNECSKFINNLRRNQSHGILFDVENYVHENYSKSISLKEVAQSLYINSAYLGQIFKKKYDVSFTDYLHNYRIKKAKELLINTDFKIYEISEKLGYKKADCFIEKFEKITGTTPFKYRKSIR